MSGELQTSALAIPVADLTVDEWLDLESEVEIVLRRKSDGLRITFAPTRERYDELVAKGEVVFSPSEVELLIEASRIEGAESLVSRAVDMKRVFTGMQIKQGWLQQESEKA